MESIPHNCKSLPLEIIHIIFQYFSSQKLSQCALVCKSWSIPAQTALYSNIVIKALLQLKKFHKTVRNNPYLGEIVKKIEFKIHLPWYNDHEAQLVTEELTIIMKDLLSTCLPNLEDLEEYRGNSYVPLLNALLDFRLERLKRISTPDYVMQKDEKANYDTCVLLMRNRIEKIVILHEFLNQDRVENKELYSNRLYERLHQFDKLVELDISRRTNDGIQILENVVATCKSLKKLIFNFQPLEESQPQNNNISVNAISNFTPSKNIECLDGKLFLSNNYKILLYIMHKFPQLSEFSLSMDRLKSARLNNHMITRLMNYCSTIDSYSLSDLPVDDQNILKTIESNWNLKSKPGSESLQLTYSDEISDRTAYLIGFSKSKNTIGSTFSLTYPVERIGEQHDEFIMKNGEYIGGLQFGFVVNYSPTQCETPGRFINRAFTHCPNLRTLTFRDCLLNRPNSPKRDLRKKLLLDELYFDGCIVSIDFLEQLSPLLPEVKRLRFCWTSFCNENRYTNSSNFSSDDTSNRIRMQNTKIDHLIREILETNYYVP